MGDLLSIIFNSPFPQALVIIGTICIAVAIIGALPGIPISRASRFGLFVFGIILVLTAILIASAMAAPTTTSLPPVGPSDNPSPTVSFSSQASPAAELTELTIWHAYGTGSAEEQAFNKVLAKAAADLPQYKINVLQIPFNDIYNKYRADVASGAGPDMFIAPNDSLGDDARAGLIADISNLTTGRLSAYSSASVDGMSLNGSLYGIPESLKAVVFWYNTSMMSTPPATTEELKNMMEAGIPVGLSYGCYHHWGFFNAFGGRIFDENWSVVADQGGIADAVDYLNDLYQISKMRGWPKTDTEGLAPFTEGKVAAITNGNWAMGDYRAALGDTLAVAPLPAGPSGPSTPMLGVDGFYFNPNSANLEEALAVAFYLTDPAGQTVMMNEAGHIPVRTDVTITDPLIRQFIAALNKGVYIRPQVPDLSKYWSNFCGTDVVFEAGMRASDWVAEATANANK